MVVVLIVSGVLVVLAIWAVVVYNGLVSLRNRIESAWAQIDVQLKRRHDLIPNLVETVKAYAAHEREALEGVIEARDGAVRATGLQEQAEAESAVSRALGSVFALAEAYPDLKANQSFLELQEELAGTEGRIAYARQFYNDTVYRYNIRIQTFPAVLVAGVFGFGGRQYFQADDDERGTVAVQF